MTENIILTAIEIGAGVTALACFAGIIWVIYDYIMGNN
jgi:multisubunit Na+/H+ antiporter MnhC subunit